MKNTVQVLSYGGGRQTVAMLLLIQQGRLPKPDRIVIADTGREKTSTWDYRAEVAEPIAQSIGLTIEIAPRELATVDLYAHNGDLLLPVYHPSGKLPAFCSTEWKRDVVRRYLRSTGIRRATMWIGYALDERRRYKPQQDDTTGPWYRSFPLIESALTKADCLEIIRAAGLPIPPPSSCWMCPNMTNEQWRQVRDEAPEDFARAVALDIEIRQENEAEHGKPIWLHSSRKPLAEADLNENDRKEGRDCQLGMCFV